MMPNVFVTQEEMGRLTAAYVRDALKGKIELTPELMQAAFTLGLDVGRLFELPGDIGPAIKKASWGIRTKI